MVTGLSSPIIDSQDQDQDTPEYVLRVPAIMKEVVHVNI